MLNTTQDYTQTGAWIVSFYKAISKFDLNESVFDQYETIILSAKTSMLISPMRRLGKVSADDFEIYRSISGLKPKETVAMVKTLEEMKEPTVGWDLSLDITGVSSFALKASENIDILNLIGKLFFELKPPAQAKLVIRILQETLQIPIPKDILIQLLTTSGFSEQTVKRAIAHLLALKIISKTLETESGSELLYNPNVFQSNAKDAYVAINGMGSKGRQEVMDILEFVKQNPGIPLSDKHDSATIDLLIKCGLIDSSAIVTGSGKVQHKFTTAPYIWGAIGAENLSSDILDDAKLLLNCLRFGQLFSTASRGKIQDPYVLIDALIRSGSVGPASAIGQDYPMPLSRGIVSIVQSKIYPDRYHMELRKDDVAKAVREVLSTKGILPIPINDAEISQKLKQKGQFVSVEQIRSTTVLPPEMEQERDSLAFSLRTHRKGR
jgi:hypothetical protein